MGVERASANAHQIPDEPTEKSPADVRSAVRLLDLGRDVYFSVRAATKFRDAKGWTGELYEVRQSLVSRARAFGVVTSEPPAWARTGFSDAEVYLLLSPVAFVLVRTHPDVVGPNARPWTAVTCIRDPQAPAPVVQPPRAAISRAVLPSTPEELARSVMFSTHALERFVERGGPATDEKGAAATLTRALATTGVASARPPHWFIEQARGTAFFAVCQYAGDEFVLPVVSSIGTRRPFMAVSCLGRDYAHAHMPESREVVQLLRETEFPEWLSTKWAPDAPPAVARGRLVRLLTETGAVYSTPPDWAGPTPAADAYLGVPGRLLLGLVWTGASEQRPLLATFLRATSDLPSKPARADTQIDTQRAPRSNELRAA
jgi:hypothetical protein